MEPDIDKIEAYITGELTGAEREAFEAELAGNPGLAEEVDAVRLAREAVELSISDHLRTQFLEWQEVEATGSKTEEAKVVTMAPRRNLRRILAIAASVLLILAVGSLWYANDQFGAGQMAMGYYDDIQLDAYVRGDSNPMLEAVEALKADDFAAADEYFRSVAEDNEQYYYAQYYLGHSLFRQQNYTGSLNVLETLNNSGNRNLREDADWLKVLSYLELEQTNDATFQTLLSAMVDDDGHTYHLDAVQLNDKLGSFWYELAN